MAAKEARPVKKSVKKPSLPKAASYPLNSAYFYYVTISRNKRRINSYYYFKKVPTASSIESLITDLIKNARLDGADPPCYGTGFADLKRRRRGIFVVAADIAGYTFNSKDGILLEELVSKSQTHTFSPSKTISLPISGPGDTVSVAYSFNAMKKQGQNRDLGEGEYEEFIIRMSPNPGPHVLLDDSGGTNLGPPVPPPFTRARQSRRTKAR